MSQTNHYTITIPCKYYIKIYLESNCGSPVDLSVFPDLQEKLRVSLDKTSGEFKFSSKQYEQERVTIIIPNDWFNRHGYFMSVKRIFNFRMLVENKLKYLMRQYITINTMTGLSITASIKTFQENYCLQEHVWSFESIKKDYDRHGSKVKLKINKSLHAEMNDLFRDNLSRMVIKSKYRNYFENESAY